MKSFRNYRKNVLVDLTDIFSHDPDVQNVMCVMIGKALCEKKFFFEIRQTLNLVLLSGCIRHTTAIELVYGISLYPLTRKRNRSFEMLSDA
jgi:hypothetical protein